VTPKRINQIQQTKNDITEALFNLLHSKRLNHIAIGELARTAGYARRTFYRHFADLEDVLDYQADRLTVELFARLNQPAHLAFTGMVSIFFVFWNDHRDFLRIMLENDRLYLIESSWVRHLNENRLERMDLRGDRYAQLFGLGGMFMLLSQWTREDFRQSPREMIAIAHDIQAHFMQH
jgi:AcrR family transcriptional regulator